MRFKGASFRQCNYYSSSSWNNEPVTKEEIILNCIVFGIPIFIFIMLAFLFMLAQISVAINDGVAWVLIIPFPIYFLIRKFTKVRFK